MGRSLSGSAGGLHRSENAGMSSEKYVRIILAESLRFLEEGSSAPSKSGAKARPKGVVDKGPKFSREVHVEQGEKSFLCISKAPVPQTDTGR